jgi:hypothetical protein
MAAVRILHLVLGFMTITNEPLELDMEFGIWTDHNAPTNSA